MKKQTRTPPTNWDRYFLAQMSDPELRRLVEEELKALRVGSAIARLRVPCRLSQAELASRAGMSPPTLSRIENSPGQNLTLGTLVRLARALDRDVAIRFGRRRRIAVRTRCPRLSPLWRPAAGHRHGEGPGRRADPPGPRRARALH